MGRNSHEREKEGAIERQRVEKESKRGRGDPVGTLFFPPPPPPSSLLSLGWLGAAAAVQDVTAWLLMPEAAGQVLCAIQCLQGELEALQWRGSFRSAL